VNFVHASIAALVKPQQPCSYPIVLVKWWYGQPLAALPAQDWRSVAVKVLMPLSVASASQVFRVLPGLREPPNEAQVSARLEPSVAVLPVRRSKLIRQPSELDH